jgi:hypothetical protein
MNNQTRSCFIPAFSKSPRFIAASTVILLALGCHAQVTYTAQLRSVFASAAAEDPLGIDPSQNLQDSASAPFGDYGAYSKTLSLTATSGAATGTGTASVDSTALWPTGFAASASTTGTTSGGSGGLLGLGETWLQAVFSVASPVSYKLTGSLDGTPQGSLYYVQLFDESANFLHDFNTAGAFEGSGVLQPGHEYYLYGYAVAVAGWQFGLLNSTSSASFDVTFAVPEPSQYAALAALGLGGWVLLRRCRRAR